MSTFAIFVICLQACLIQVAFGQCGCNYASVGPSIAQSPLSYSSSPCGSNIAYGAGIGSLGYGTASPSSLSYGVAGPSPLSYAAPGPSSFASWGGVGSGDVSVVGNFGVGGNTLVTGQVPVLGGTGFTGTVPAAGAVTISGSCGYPCGCNNAYGGNYY